MTFASNGLVVGFGVLPMVAEPRRQRIWCVNCEEAGTVWEVKDMSQSDHAYPQTRSGKPGSNAAVVSNAKARVFIVIIDHCK